MLEPIKGIGGLVGTMGTLFLLAAAILWVVIPFAVFGIKNRIDRTNALLRELINLTAHSKAQ